ncbi:hypothetical protein PTSG_07305 [Salpingoeca rosetta]|uniref:Serine aminopeptidase S33 domain-containing protein n=1 Tax=Salpingoeca rosetta (strain ATCC 50818 / BSB-021) TaxID=946362 RepID=F2UJ14_SALR5|nr:uncharacterized protein PTSG_07305 [Salpingoeca rosetta]EGD76962.1 hypothetical protein PTSG_07305 [Salpingoeca rosetta]|eukprot:XP_004990802.1 hypothetical protein PTSG_07305 [Salpingoeca rosetta]
MSGARGGGVEKRRSFVTERGVRLDERRWVPEDRTSIRGFIFLAHGYAHHIDAYAERVGSEELMQQGFAVFGVSHHAHGHSEGLRCLVNDYQHLVDDFADYMTAVFKEFTDQGITRPCFIIGQSMGGALTLLLAAPNSRVRQIVSGVVLLAPMCKIADEMMLPQWLINMMYWTAYVLPWAPLTPVTPTEHLCFKDPKVRIVVVVVAAVVLMAAMWRGGGGCD